MRPIHAVRDTARRMLPHPAPKAHPYDNQFFADQSPGSLRSAEAVLPIVLELLRPASVVDVGCGTGAWLSVCRRHGVPDVLGIDGAAVDGQALEIPRESFLRHDLTTPIGESRRFDLALSLEVAEHIPAEHAATFVDSVARLSPVVLFSAAVPHQPGVRHVNCRWPSYWAALFQERGYAVADPVRPLVWHDERVDYWYAQNALLFISRDHLDGRPGLAERLGVVAGRPLDLVHPQLLEHHMRPIGARGAWSLLLEALRRRARRQFGQASHMTPSERP